MQDYQTETRRHWVRGLHRKHSLILDAIAAIVGALAILAAILTIAEG
jgi:hypothetical protein